MKASHVKGHCRINPSGYSEWHSRLKNGRPKVWGYNGERSKKWTTEEIERVLEALESLPEFLRGQPVDGLFRMDKSQEPRNPSTTNMGDTVLYDTAFDEKHNLAHILAHEQAHRLYDKLTRVQKDGFELAGEWIRLKAGRKAQILPGRSSKTFIDQDGMMSPEEDFANGTEAYVFKPEKLKSVSPRVYNWIDANFGASLRGRKE